MPAYILTREADADLESIWDYTEMNWGRKQARKYLTQLENRFIFLAKRPAVGRSRHDIPGSPRSFHEGRHVIFYRKTNE